MPTGHQQRRGLHEFRLLGSPRPTLRASCFITAAVLVLSACTSPEPLPADADPAFASVYEQAKEADADGAQLDILRRAAVAGEVTFQDVTEALSATFECFDKGGGGHIDEGVVLLESGLAFPNYGWGGGVTDEEMERLSAVGDACLHKHSYYVETLYQTQPIAQEAEAAAFEARRASVIACLNAKGVLLEADATRADIESAVSAEVVDLTQGGTVSSAQADAVIGCLAPPS